LLVVGCWLLVVGCWLLVVGCWSEGTAQSLTLPAMVSGFGRRDS
jgi:hypothetical protein